MFALSWLAYASYYLGRKGFSVTKVAIAGALGLSPASLALIDTAFLSAYAFGQVPSGVLGDRIGPRRLVAFGLIGSAAACAAFGAASSAAVLMLCFALNGLAQSTGWPGTTKAMALVTEARERGRVMGVWSTCYQLGGVAATALATFMLAHHGWRAAFFGPALWLLAMALAVYTFLPSFAATRAAAPAVDSADSRIGLRGLLRDPRVLSYGAAYFCLKLIRYSLLFWLPYYLHTAEGFDEVSSGYLSTSFEIGGALGAAGLGYISDRSGRSRAALSALSIAGLAVALLLYALLPAADALLHFALMALIGALLFGPDALLSGAAAQDAGGPNDAATAAGIVNGMGSCGALLQGVITVAVQQAFGWNALFYVFFALSLVACACLWPAMVTSARR